MSEAESKVLIKQVDSAYRQIAAHFEKQIWSGQLKPGQRMPTTSAIARQFDVNPNTVQQGFELLMTRGLVERRRRLGTFVNPGVKTKTAGIVFGKGIFTDLNLRFFSVVLMELQREFAEVQWDTRLYCTAELVNSGKVIAELENDLRSGKIRALVEFCSSAKVKDWVWGEGVAALMPLPEISNTSLIVSGLHYLAAAGYRRPAIIFDVETLKGADEKVEAAKTEMERLGLSGDGCSLSHCGISDRAGYQAAKALFKQPSSQRPDSLLVANDNACRGVIYAALESGIAIPAQLGLITHRNKGIDIFSPVPLTCLEVDPTAYAKTLIQFGMAKIEGRSDGDHRNMVGTDLVIGESCGEKLKPV